MISKGALLRYQISSWRQLPECRSNNSKDLRLHVSDLFNNDMIRGFKIWLDHPSYGVLFACVLDGRGMMITELDGNKSMTSDQILRELERFGFLITYHPNKDLNSKQIEYLITLKGLLYDKIRLMRVWTPVSGTSNTSLKIVAFRSDKLGDWLNNWYSPSEQEFTKALVAGTAVNLTDMSRTYKFNWDWLDYVANIDDILRDSADDLVYQRKEDEDD